MSIGCEKRIDSVQPEKKSISRRRRRRKKKCCIRFSYLEGPNGPTTDGNSVAPEKVVLTDRAVRAALEAATAATDRARHDMRDAFSHSSIVAMHSQVGTTAEL